MKSCCSCSSTMDCLAAPHHQLVEAASARNVAHRRRTGQRAAQQQQHQLQLVTADAGKGTNVQKHLVEPKHVASYSRQCCHPLLFRPASKAAATAHTSAARVELQGGTPLPACGLVYERLGGRLSHLHWSRWRSGCRRAGKPRYAGAPTKGTHAFLLHELWLLQCHHLSSGTTQTVGCGGEGPRAGATRVRPPDLMAAVGCRITRFAWEPTCPSASGKSLCLIPLSSRLLISVTYLQARNRTTTCYSCDNAAMPRRNNPRRR